MKISKSKYCQCLYFSSNALARKMDKLASESWKQVHLSPSLAYLLMLVIEEPGIQAGSLADQMLLMPSTITRLLDKLEERKLLVRSTEGKQIHLFATSKSKEIYNKLRECVQHFNQSCVAILGKDESDRMVRHMNKLTDRL